MHVQAQIARISSASRQPLSAVARRRLEHGLIRVGDVAVVALVGLLVTSWRFAQRPMPGSTSIALIMGCLIAASLLPLSQALRTGRLETARSTLGCVLFGWSATIASLIVLLYAMKMSDEVSRLWLGVWFVSGALSLVTFRLAVDAAFSSSGFPRPGVVVIGTGERMEAAIERLANPNSGVRVAAVFDLEIGESQPHGPRARPYWNLAALERTVCDSDVDQLLLALPPASAEAVKPLIHSLRNLAIDVNWMLDPIEISCVHMAAGTCLDPKGMVDIGDLGIVRLLNRPLDGWGYVAKTLEDRILAAMLLALTAPLMLLIAAAVKLDSPGPAIYVQRRRGFLRKPIDVLKFRTMHADRCDGADARSVRQATRNDDRVTRVGRLLRRTSLDELPQLINVLRGEMSIVGPRPHAVSHDDSYAALIDDYSARHRVRPGMTGWAQIHGYRGETRSLGDMRTRVRLDLEYIDRWSFGLDLRIICRTALIWLFDRNAY